MVDDLARLAENPLVKGVRRIIQFESDPDFCLRPDFVRGVQLLPRHGLSFDLCIKCHQMPNTIGLVQRCPEVRFILDHIGKPNIYARYFMDGPSDLHQLLIDLVARVRKAGGS